MLTARVWGGRSAKHSKPDVSIVPCRHTGYWLISIACKDRNKLLFDTVRRLTLQLFVPTHPFLMQLNSDIPSGMVSLLSTAYRNCRQS